VTSPRPHPLDQVEIRFGLAGGVLVLAVAAARLLGLDVEYAGLLLLVVCAGLAGAVGRGRAVVLGLTAWALLTGFVAHRYGELSLAPADLRLMAVFVATALASSRLLQHGTRSTQPATYRRTA
jgi:hypothetical protein